MPSPKYPLAAKSWAQTGTPSLEIKFASGKRIASFPLAFIKDGGDNTWRYVLEVVDLVVDQSHDLSGVITDLKGAVLDLDDVPCAGTFTYKHLGLLLLSAQTSRPHPGRLHKRTHAVAWPRIPQQVSAA